MSIIVDSEQYLYYKDCEESLRKILDIMKDEEFQSYCIEKYSSMNVQEKQDFERQALLDQDSYLALIDLLLIVFVL